MCPRSAWAARTPTASCSTTGRQGGRKSDINPTTGDHFDPATPPSSGSDTLRGRLQADETEWGIGGDVYIAEAQYVAKDEHRSGGGKDNVAWRQIEVEPDWEVRAVAPTESGEAALFAWPDFVPGVKVIEFALEDEGGEDVHGHYVLGYHATDLGAGLWRYEYAVQNLTSARAAGSFAIPIPCGVNVSDLYLPRRRLPQR